MQTELKKLQDENKKLQAVIETDEQNAAELHRELELTISQCIKEKRRADIAEKALINRIKKLALDSFNFCSDDKEEIINRIIQNAYNSELKKAELEI